MEISSRPSRFLIVLCFLIFSVVPGFSQESTNNNVFKNVTLRYRDGRTEEVVVNELKLLQYGVFESSDRKLEVDTRNLTAVTIDTTHYIVREFQNPSWILVQSNIILLQLVEDGKIKLYSTALKYRDRHLFAEKDTTFRQLREYDKHVDQSHILKVHEYRSILRYMMSDCNAPAARSIEILNFDFENIAQAIRDYNRTCGVDLLTGMKDGHVTAFASEKTKQLEHKQHGVLMLIAGYAYGNATLNYSSSYWQALFLTSPEISLNRPFAGFGLRVSPTLEALRLSLKTQTTFEMLKSSAARQSAETSPNYAVSMNYQFGVIRNQLAAEYALLFKENFGVDVGVAGGMTYTVMNKSNFQQVIAYTSTFSTRNRVDLEPRHKIQFTRGATVSLRYYSFSLQYQIILNKNYEWMSDGESDVHESRITLGWTFPKSKKS